MNDLLSQTDSAEQISCPVCGDNSDIYPVHQLYSNLLMGDKILGEIRPGMPRMRLIKLISPPPIPRKNLASSLNPDFLMALGLIVVIYVNITGIADLRDHLFQMGIGVVILLAVYLLTRSWFINRHRSALDKRAEQVAEIRAKADIWMMLNYCPKDDLVFSPDYSIKMELSQLTDFLNSGMGDQG
jgi:hypothetical protein